jgi:hypothetical protein
MEIITPIELKKSIAGAESKELFNEVFQTIVFQYIDYSLSFKGASALYEYVNQQCVGWHDLLESGTPPGFNSSVRYFNDLRAEISKFVRNNVDANSDTFSSSWQSINTKIRGVEGFPLPYDCPETDFLMKVYKNVPESFTSAYRFLVGQLDSNIYSNRDNYLGAQLACDFVMKNFSDISSKLDAEKASLKRLKNDFKKYLSKSENEIVEHLSNAGKKYEEYTGAIDTLKTNKEGLFTKWFEESKKMFEGFDKSSSDTVKNLEKAYNELLSLKSPAKYWNLRAIKLKIEGWEAIKWLLILVAITCASLYFLLWQTPEGMLLSFIKGEASAIKWSIIYVTFVAFLTFGIRALNKIAFSSFHLARDAEEREQLTFVYLALIKEGVVTNEDRNLILQSLFSRADTGLLKDDSSPAMPTNDLSKLLNNR